MKSDLAKKVLLIRITQISENCWCAGWLVNLEYVLFEYAIGINLVCDTEDVYKLANLSERKAYGKELYELFISAEGWWVWDEKKGDVFLDKVSWLKRFENWCIKRS